MTAAIAHPPGLLGLVGWILGCAPPGGGDTGTDAVAVLPFTDTNVVRISGGYADAAVAVAESPDVCIDASGLGATVVSIEVWQLGINEGALRCALARGTLTQASFKGGLFVSAPADGRACLSGMDLYQDEPVLTCEPGTAWLVVARGADDAPLAYQILDPCQGSGASEVTIDATAPSFEDVVVDIGGAESLHVRAGVRYTLDWASVSTDAFGGPVEPTDLTIVVAGELADGTSFVDGILGLEDGGGTYYELWAHPGETERDLAEGYTGPGFPGFEVGPRYLIGFSPPSDCVPASVIATVDVSG